MDFYIDWTEILPALGDPAIVREQFSDCCWAIACSYCVSARRRIETEGADTTWLSPQYLIDYALDPMREFAKHNRSGRVAFDKHNCYALKPVASLMFTEMYGIGSDLATPLTGARRLIPPVRQPDERRVYIDGYNILKSIGEGLTEAEAYLALLSGPMMGTVRMTKEFASYTGEGVIEVAGTYKDLAHSISIIGMDSTRRAFRILNSGGLGWGENGKGWIRYELVFDILAPGPTSLQSRGNFVYPTEEFSFTWQAEFAYAVTARGYSSKVHDLEGTHDELIKDPESRNLETEEEDMSLDLDKTIRRGLSTKRSISTEDPVYLGKLMAKMSSRGQVAYGEAGNVVEHSIGAIRTVANAATFIDKLPEGLDAVVGEHGSQMSAGEKQIFAFTRAILKNPEFLLVDEAKSALDAESEGVMQNALENSMKNGNIDVAGQAVASYKSKPNIDAYDTSRAILNDIKGAVELRDVYFKYLTRPDVQIFSGFSLNIPSCASAALVGYSESGKSTVISLLELFYDPDSGQVLIGGVDFKRFQLKWLRGNMGLVSQEPILFAISIKSNIAYGKENATEEEIRTAIELANAATFTDKLPEGLDTMVGEHGTQMSGGQKQRIAITRAILKNPKFFLLDEATSALDAESESVVQNALEKIITNRTNVVVAHCLTTIRSADMVAVVHAGKLAEKGTHDELLKDPESRKLETEEDVSLNLDKTIRRGLSIKRSISTENPVDLGMNFLYSGGWSI